MLRTLILLVPLLLLPGCAAGINGKTFTRVHIFNHCYEDVAVEYKNLKNKKSFERGQPRRLEIDQRDGDLAWVKQDSSLPHLIIAKENTPVLDYPASRIKAEARRDVWLVAGTEVTTYSLVMCPREAPLGEEGSLTRPAKAGEPVHEFFFSGEPHKDSRFVYVNGLRLLRASSREDGSFSFLLSPGVTGEIAVSNRFGTVKRRIGHDIRPLARKAKAGEQILVPPTPVTPKGAWE